ncbi:hypothetical protein D3C79_896980 [compost metagenome]
MPINNPARLSGRPRSAVIYSGISMMYRVLQVHINIEAINSRRTSGFRQSPAGAIGAEDAPSGSSPCCADWVRGTEGKVNHTSKAQIAKVAAAMINIQVKP